ncbi:hypothetical protein VM1G_11895 [Cytospora mali]|uniref:Uncharacterized protein n=1 Tax=Cytospora mali TaxID=578113 RepID=A0A194WAY1_CYTMA|nr:hypothetical protein VM1G_11895 [Valsa mali]
MAAECGTWSFWKEKLAPVVGSNWEWSPTSFQVEDSKVAEERNSPTLDTTLCPC